MKTARLQNSSKEYPIGKMVCIGRNYAAHAAELGNEVPDKPILFLKPSSAVIYSGGKIEIPSISGDLHHEVELTLLIGTTIKNIDEKQAEDAIIAYGVGLDMTLRDVQTKLKNAGHPWTIAKCFDTSAVLSPFILKEDYSLSLDEVITLSVNGITKQNEKLNLMIYKPAALVQYIASIMTLEEGDIIFTGTPAGVSKAVSGDKLSASITGIASLNCEIA